MSSKNEAGKPPPACNLFALRQATRSATILYDRHLAKAGLTTSQWSILNAIKAQPGLAMQSLAEAMVMDRTTLLRALKPLTAEGLVLQQPSESNPRKLQLSLTPAGQARLAQARSHWQQAQDEFESQFGAEEALALRAMLQNVPRAR